MIHTGFTFFKSYIVKRGFLDGYEGLMVAMNAMNHTFYKYAKLYQANKNRVRKEVLVKQPVEENATITEQKVLEFVK
jgi:hypothetical protein